MPHASRISTVHVEYLGDELCVYDWQRMEVHTLNATAALVWQHCDGQTSPAQIAAILAAQVATADAEALVWLALEDLQAARLIAGADERPVGRLSLTRRQFIKGGVAAAAALPMVISLVAPAPVAAQSPIPTTRATAILPATAQPTATTATTATTASGSPTATTAPTTAPTAAPTNTPLPTATSTPLPTNTPTVTPTPLPTPTGSPTPTVTPTPLPTNTPTNTPFPTNPPLKR